jgi:hypothetical protein
MNLSDLFLINKIVTRILELPAILGDNGKVNL